MNWPRLISAHGDGLFDHEVAYPSLESLLRRDVARLCRRRLEQEPADECEPGAAERAFEDEHAEAKRDEEETESPSEHGRDPCRPGEIPRVPQSRVEHATAVEGQRRKQVEREQDEVRVTEPGGDPVERVGESSGRQPDEEHTQHERNEGSRDRNPELGAGPRKRALELGDSTEEPEVDAFDLDALSLGLQSVAELVQSEAKKRGPPRRPTRCTRRPRSRDSGRGRPQMRETRR